MATLADAWGSDGLDQLLSDAGYAMTTDDGDSLTALVVDDAPLFDPTDEAKAKKPLYAIIHAKVGSVGDPRTVSTFTRTTDSKTYRVIEFQENAGSAEWKWKCEVQRL